MNFAFLMLTSCLAGADPVPAAAAPAPLVPVASAAPASGACCGGNCGSGNCGSCNSGCDACNPCCEKEGCLAKLKKRFKKKSCCDDCCAPTMPSCGAPALTCAPCAAPACDQSTCCEKQSCFQKLRHRFKKKDCCEPTCCESTCCNTSKCCGTASIAAASHITCDDCCCAKENCFQKLMKCFKKKKNECCDSCCDGTGAVAMPGAGMAAPAKPEPIAPPKESKKMPEGATQIVPMNEAAPKIPAATSRTAPPAEVPF